MTARIDRRTIVVGVDDSATALNAARWSAYLADAFHAPLLIACATKHPGPHIQRSAARPRRSRQHELAREIAARGVELVRTCTPGLTVDTVLFSGPPGPSLVKLSEHARIVAVGAQTAFESRLIGPTTMHVAGHAHCPVAVWRGAEGRPLRRRLPVAVGVDGTALSSPAIAHAFEIASALGVSLIAVHAWPSRIEPVGHHPDRDEEERVLLAESLAGWRTEYPDVEVTELPLSGLATTVLTELSARVQLLVVGSRGRSTTTAALFGSTSRDLLHHVSCPVLICGAGNTIQRR